MEKVQHIQIKLVNPVMLLLLALFAAQVSLAAELNDGLQEGKLKPCPDSPNCISSEQGMIEPVVFNASGSRLIRINRTMLFKRLRLAPKS
jgi:uncharacterized protein (DUF1499 family)